MRQGSEATMSAMGILLLVLLCAASRTNVAPPPPQLLLHTAQCLTAKQFMEPARSKTLTLGFLLDEKSYPGDKVVYLISYATPAGSNGLVFAVLLTERGASQTFNIQNNARFVLSNRDPSGVSFVPGGDPLGGIWTQQHLASAIKRIERQPRFTIPVGDLATPDASIRCEAYTDPQRKDAPTRRP
jgi:hypothetical protein